jgi:flagellin
MSLNTQRNLYTSNLGLATSIQRLSSGLRVNSAKDDAAGLAIAERMNAQIRGSNVAIRNANDGISLSQTAEGALGKIGDSLQRMRELAVQSANATNSSDDRENLQAEFKQLQDEINRVVNGTKFNNTFLFTGSSAFDFQVGAGTTSNDTVSIARSQLSGGTAGTSGSLSAATSTAAVIATITGSASAITGSTAVAAKNAIKDIDVALDKLNAERATYGAAQNRFESVIGTLQISVENISAARSRIMDTDFAAETANLTRTQILTQAGTAMLAQANQAPQNVLSLLR